MPQQIDKIISLSSSLSSEPSVISVSEDQKQISQEKPTEERFQFIDKITYQKHLTCKICKLMFVKPMRMHPCGHTFCYKCCMHHYILLCPICDFWIEDKQNDLLAIKLIQDLKVKCKSDDCPWKGTFDEFNQFHLSECKLKNGGISAWLQSMQQTLKETEQKIKCSSGSEDNQDKPDQQVLNNEKIELLKMSEPRTVRFLNDQSHVFVQKKNKSERNIVQMIKDHQQERKDEVTSALLTKYSASSQILNQSMPKKTKQTKKHKEEEEEEKEKEKEEQSKSFINNYHVMVPQRKIRNGKDLLKDKIKQRLIKMNRKISESEGRNSKQSEIQTSKSNFIIKIRQKQSPSINNSQ